MFVLVEDLFALGAKVFWLEFVFLLVVQPKCGSARTAPVALQTSKCRLLMHLLNVNLETLFCSSTVGTLVTYKRFLTCNKQI